MDARGVAVQASPCANCHCGLALRPSVQDQSALASVEAIADRDGFQSAVVGLFGALLVVLFGAVATADLLALNVLETGALALSSIVIVLLLARKLRVRIERAVQLRIGAVPSAGQNAGG